MTPVFPGREFEMTRSTNYSRSILLVAAVLMLVPVLVTPAGAVTGIGQIATSGARLDGVAVPSGTTLLSPSLVETDVTPAILHLRNGQVIALGAESAARLEGLASGAVRVVVKVGRISMVRPSGGAMTLSENSAFVMSQEGEPELAGQQELAGAQEGEASTEEAEEPEVRLCELVDSTPEKFMLCTIDDPGFEECDWELLKVPESKVPNYLNISSVYASTHMNGIGMDEHCKERLVGKIWPVKIWPVKIWPVEGGISVGPAIGSVVLVEVIEDDDEEPASPSTP